MKIRKLICTVLAMVMLVMAVPLGSVTAGAESIYDTAIEMEAMEIYSEKFGTGLKDYDDVHHEYTTYYEMSIPKDGSVVVKCYDMERYKGYDNKVQWELIDVYGSSVGKGTFFDVKSSGTINGIKKGTYYLSMCAESRVYTLSFFYSFIPSENPTIDLKLTIKKGNTIQLGSIVENYTGKVTWLSTKKSVATISTTGKVTAKKKGTTTIRASLDDGTYVQIKIVVTK